MGHQLTLIVWHMTLNLPGWEVPRPPWWRFFEQPSTWKLFKHKIGEDFWPSPTWKLGGQLLRLLEGKLLQQEFLANSCKVLTNTTGVPSLKCHCNLIIFNWFCVTKVVLQNIEIFQKLRCEDPRRLWLLLNIQPCSPSCASPPMGLSRLTSHKQLYTKASQEFNSHKL